MKRSLNPAEMRGGAFRLEDLPNEPGKILSMLQAEPRDAVVYFARRGPFIKIGTTCRLKRRLAALTSYRDPAGKVGPMQLLVTVPGGRIVEGCYHRQFAELSVDGHGEWFHAGAQLLEWVLVQLHAEAADNGRVESIEWLRGYFRDYFAAIREVTDGQAQAAHA